jgi:hypothetical protein
MKTKSFDDLQDFFIVSINEEKNTDDALHLYNEEF